MFTDYLDEIKIEYQYISVDILFHAEKNNLYIFYGQTGYLMPTDWQPCKLGNNVLHLDKRNLYVAYFVPKDDDTDYPLPSPPVYHIDMLEDAYNQGVLEEIITNEEWNRFIQENTILVHRPIGGAPEATVLTKTLENLDFYLTSQQKDEINSIIAAFNATAQNNLLTEYDYENTYGRYYDFNYNLYKNGVTKEQLKTLFDKAKVIENAVKNGIDFDVDDDLAQGFTPPTYLNRVLCEDVVNSYYNAYEPARDVLASITATDDEILNAFSNLENSLVYLGYRYYSWASYSILDASQGPKNIYLRGDVNFDGKLDIADVVLTQKHLAKLAPLTDQQKYFANLAYESSSTVDMQSIVLMQKHIARLITATKYSAYVN